MLKDYQLSQNTEKKVCLVYAVTNTIITMNKKLWSGTKISKRKEKDHDRRRSTETIKTLSKKQGS